MLRRLPGLWCAWLLLSVSLAWAQNPIAGDRTIYGAFNTGTATGATNAYILTLTPPIQSYHVGACYAFFAHVANTGAATLNVNGRGAVALVKRVAGVSTPLAANDIGIGQRVVGCYDGTVLQTDIHTGGTGGSLGAVTVSGPTATNQVPVTTSTVAGAWQRLAIGTAGALQAADGNGLFAAYGGSFCPLPNTFVTSQSPTGALGCAALPAQTATPLLTQANGTFPNGVNLGAKTPGFVSIAVSGGIASVTTVPPPAGDLVGTAGPQTLSATFVEPRRHSLSDPLTTGGLVSPTPRDYDMEYVSAVSQPFTVVNPVGGVPGQWYRLSFQSLAPQAITWQAQYNEGAGIPKPAMTTGANVRDVFLLEYDPTTGQWQFLYNSQLFALAFGAGGGTATAAGTYKDIQFHNATTGLDADVGRFFYDPIIHSLGVQQAVHGTGPGVVELKDPHGYKLLLMAGSLTQDRAITFGDTDSLGDVSTATSTSVDSEVALFSGTGGKTLKRATGTGIARLASGVQTAAELSGDCTTSGSNAVTCTKLNGGAFAGTSGNVVSFGASNVPADSGLVAATLVTKTPVVTTLTTSTTYTCPWDTVATTAQCEMQMTAGAGTLTVAAPSGGTPPNGRMMLMGFLCSNAQTFSFNAIFIASPNVALPVTCPAGVTMWTQVGARYSTVLSKWQVIATN